MDLREAHRFSTERHPWETARFNYFREVLVRHVAMTSAPLRVLDLGSGDAWFSRQLLALLPAGSTITCVDANYNPVPEDEPGLHFRTSIRQVEQQAHSSSDGAERFDVILLLDVLEHIRDDFSVLREIVQTCAHESTMLVISVPAWQSLFGAHDRHLAHFRRYSPGAIARLVQSVGLEIIERGGLFHSLVVPRAVLTATEWLRPKTEPARSAMPARWLARTLQSAFAIDNSASRWFAKMGVEVPGLSWYGVCRKVR